MAISAWHNRHHSRARLRYLVGSLLLAGISILLLIASPTWAGRSLAPVPLALGFWCWVRWRRRVTRDQSRIIVGSRLTRLPDDFVVLHAVSVPAPWGRTEIDHVVISRFGVVVIGDGPSPGWMMEPVEAVRSLLISRGLVQPGFPIQSLVLLPPGVAAPRQIEQDTAIVRIEHVKLDHLAPSRRPVFTPNQIRSIAQALMGEQEKQAQAV